MWPNISFIKRKPKPLGTEFKVFVDSITNVMCWLEIQEGKKRMKRKPYFRRLGATASCVRRSVQAGNKFVVRNKKKIDGSDTTKENSIHEKDDVEGVIIMDDDSEKRDIPPPPPQKSSITKNTLQEENVHTDK